MKKTTKRRLLSGAMALALVATTVTLPGKENSLNVSAAEHVLNSGETVRPARDKNGKTPTQSGYDSSFGETDLATLLAGKDEERGILGDNLATTLKNYENTYLLGVAADFCVYLNDNFTVYESDTEGRAAIGGDLNIGTEWGSYAIGKGDYGNLTPLEELLDNSEYAHIILNGMVHNVPYVGGSGSKNRNALLDDSYYTKEHKEYGNHENSKAGDKTYTKRFVIQYPSTYENYANYNDTRYYQGDTRGNSAGNWTTKTGTDTWGGRLPSVSPGVDGNGPTGQKEGQYGINIKVDSRQAYFTTILKFDERFNFLQNRSQTMASVGKAAAKQEITYSTNNSGTITLKYTGDEDYAECVYFNLSDEEWNNYFTKAYTIRFENIPKLPVEDYPNGRPIADNKGGTTHWDYAYIIVNVGATAKQETYSNARTSIVENWNETKSYVHMTNPNNMSGNKVTIISPKSGQPITISNAGGDGTNNNPGVSSLMYNFYKMNPGDVLVLGNNFSGTIFAPNADVTDEWMLGYSFHGHLSGALVANSFEGATEFGYRSCTVPANVLGVASKYDAEVSKTDSAGNYVEGATLSIYKWEDGKKGELVKSLESEDTSLIFKELKDGKYVLTEDVAPDGYTKSSKDIYFEVQTETDKFVQVVGTNTDPINNALYFGSFEVTLKVYEDSKFNENTAVKYTYNPLEIEYNSYVVGEDTYTLSGTRTSDMKVYKDGKLVANPGFKFYAATANGTVGFLVTYKDPTDPQAKEEIVYPNINLTKQLSGDLNKFEADGFEIINRQNLTITKMDQSGKKLEKGLKVEFKLTATGTLKADDLKDVKFYIDGDKEKIKTFEGKTSCTFTGQSFEFEGLPDGTYTLEEVTAPDGFSKLNVKFTITIKDGKVASVKTTNENDEKYVEVKNGDGENTINVLNDLAVIEIFKKDIKGEDIPKLFGDATFTLTSSVSPVGAKINGILIASNDKNLKQVDGKYQYTLIGRDFKFEGLKDGDYTLTEVSAPSEKKGYEKVNNVLHFTVKAGKIATSVIKDTDGEIAESENEFKLDGNKITVLDGYITNKVSIEKIWNDNDVETARPEEITVTVTGTVEGYKYATITKDVVLKKSENAAENWKADVTFTPEDIAFALDENSNKLPLYYYVYQSGQLVDLKPYTYTYKEKPVDGYGSDTTIDIEDNKGTVSVKNTLLTSVTITKEWVNDVNGVDAKRPSEIELTVVGTVKIDGKDEEISSEKVKFTGTGATWNYTVENLPAYYYSDGTSYPITYTVKEETVPAGYVSTVKDTTATNTYKTGSIKFAGTKTVKNELGTAPSNVSYEFVVDEVDEDGKVIQAKVATGKVTGQGAITFTEIKYGYEDIGQHIYQITETKGSVSGMTYDSSVKKVVVNVADSTTDKLSVAIVKGESDAIAFTNTFVDNNLKTGSITFKGTKTVKNLKGEAPEETYQFRVYEVDKDNNLIPGQDHRYVASGEVTGDGSFNFTKIEYSYDDIGDHIYKIVEVEGDTDDMTYDSTVKTITVRVADTGTKTLSTTIVKASSSADAENLGFTNTYEDTTKKNGSITLTGTKIVENVKGTAPEETYEFIVDEVDKDGNTLAFEVAKATVTGSGKITFTIKYTSDDIGTHIYKVSEVKGDTDDMTYDSTIKTVVVNVEDTDAATLSATIVSASSDDVVFTNTYEDSAKKTGSITFTGTKTVENVRGTAPKETYTFKVVEVDANGKVINKNVATGTVTGEGKITFTPIKYDSDDIGGHIYKITENEGTTGDMIYDDSTKTVVVTVEDTDAATLSATIVSASSDEIAFTNTYEDSTKKTGSIKFTGIKSIENVNGTAPEEEYEFIVVEVDENGEFLDLNAATGKVTGEGEINFTPINYTSDDIGVHIYKIAEREGDTDDMTYDESIKTVVVRVEDTGAKRLSVSIISASSDDLDFTNIYEDSSKVEKEGSITLTGTKIVKNVKGTAPKETYTFVVYEVDKDGELIGLEESIGTANGAGKITFTPIKYTSDDIGGHIYKVVEIEGKTGDMTYDESIKTVIVNVEDTGDETLSVTIISASSDDIVFTNTYEEEETTTEEGTTEEATTEEVTTEEATTEEVTTEEVTTEEATTEEVTTEEVTTEEATTEETTTEEATTEEATTEEATTEEVTTEEATTEEVTTEEVTTEEVTTEEVTTEEGTTEEGTTESKKGGLIIVVTDEETGDRVSGATVTVTDSEGNSTDYVTDENGTITIEDLDEGDYDITVKEVPDGYKVTTGETATVFVESGKTTVHEAYIIPSSNSSNNNNSNNNSNGNSTSQTQTGDAFNMILPVGMILVSLAGVAVIAIRRRKRY